uniref:Ovule protein n=1 Tax=Nippostrongylus brasiliensis TaxID=27835 RepID=A0A0N4YDC3_NIPBR
MSHPPSDVVKKQLNLYQCETSLLWKSKGGIDNANLPLATIQPTYIFRETAVSPYSIFSMFIKSAGTNTFPTSYESLDPERTTNGEKGDTQRVLHVQKNLDHTHYLTSPFIHMKG